MSYQLTKHKDIPNEKKHGISIDIYPSLGNCGFVLVDTDEGHNQEFCDVQSTFNYIVLEGSGSFFLNDEEVGVEKGDSLSISPNTRIYYKGKMKLALLISPAWRPENERETKESIW